MGGDLLASFLKRRLGIISSESALGLDQSLEALVPALVCRTPFAFQATDILIIVLAFLSWRLCCRGCCIVCISVTVPSDAPSQRRLASSAWRRGLEGMASGRTQVMQGDFWRTVEAHIDDRDARAH
jgi:hypothetical protein